MSKNQQKKIPPYPTSKPIRPKSSKTHFIPSQYLRQRLSYIFYLKKFHQVSIPDEKIKSLIQTYPDYFLELSYIPIKSRRIITKKVDSGALYLWRKKGKKDQEANEEWFSEGEIELGKKINEQKMKMFQNVEIKKYGSLKPYEIQFLQQCKRQKQKYEGEQRGEKKLISQNTRDGTSDQEDEKVKIQGSSVYKSQFFQLKYKSSQLLQNNESDKYQCLIYDYQEQSSDNDIFYQKSNSFSNQQYPTQATNLGKVYFPQGQFSLFALNQNTNSQEKVWWVFNLYDQFGPMDSQQMDINYHQKYCYYLIKFNQSAYSSYQNLMGQYNNIIKRQKQIKGRIWNQDDLKRVEVGQQKNWVSIQEKM